MPLAVAAGRAARALRQWQFITSTASGSHAGAARALTGIIITRVGLRLPLPVALAPLPVTVALRLAVALALAVPTQA